MTYQRIYDLKFKKNMSTLELRQRFPSQKKKITTVALLELPIKVLKGVIADRKEFSRLLDLKKTLQDNKKSSMAGKKRKAS